MSCRSHELRGAPGVPSSSTAPSRSGALPVDARGVRLLHRLRPEMALRAGRDRRALRRATRSGCASRSRATSRRPATSRMAASRRGRAPRASSRVGSRAPRSRGSRPRSPRRRSGRYERAAEMAARCRELLAAARRPRSPSDATLVTFPRAGGRRRSRHARLTSRRRSSASSRARSSSRASCGWWKNEDRSASGSWQRARLQDPAPPRAVRRPTAEVVQLGGASGPSQRVPRLARPVQRSRPASTARCTLPSTLAGESGTDNARAVSGRGVDRLRSHDVASSSCKDLTVRAEYRIIARLAGQRRLDDGPSTPNGRTVVHADGRAAP